MRACRERRDPGAPVAPANLAAKVIAKDKVGTNEHPGRLNEIPDKTRMDITITCLQVTNLMALRRVGNEIDVLRRLSHPGILKLEKVLHSSEHLYLITERGGHDLFDFFEANPDRVPPGVARKIMTGILDPIAFCHANGVCHRDLKPENVLLRSKENLATGEIDVSDVKLCDFGLCENVEDGQMLEDFCGSPGFFAPEIVTTKRHDGKMADIWSVGCILLELTLGHEYFNKMWMAAYDYNLLSKPAMFQVRPRCFHKP